MCVWLRLLGVQRLGTQDELSRQLTFFVSFGGRRDENPAETLQLPTATICVQTTHLPDLSSTAKKASHPYPNSSLSQLLHHRRTEKKEPDQIRQKIFKAMAELLCADLSSRPVRDNLEAWLEASTALLGAGEYDRAKLLLSSVLQAHPDSVQAHTQLVLTHLHLEQSLWPKALQIAR